MTKCEGDCLCSTANEASMETAKSGLFRRIWIWFERWALALDHSPFDYAWDRIGQLENEVKELREETRRNR